jgi:diguanylate cyclase (GGDEF)-like protein/PAS domain S-box-containing protein
MNEHMERAESDRLAALFEAAVDAIVIADDHGTIERVNASCEEMFGYARGALVGQNISCLMPAVTAAGHDRNLERYRNGGRREVIGRGRDDVAQRADGSEFPIHLSVSEFEADGQTWYVGIVRDISALAAAERRRDELIRELRSSREQFREAATHDDLTGLANRTLFLDELDRAISMAARTGEELTVAFIDLDRFKLVNDTLGHDAGDVLLQAVATRLDASVGASDRVARLAGDEFVVMLRRTSPLELDGALGRILESVSAPIDLGSGPIDVAVSVGAASYPRDSREPERLLQAADLAMYEAKREGGNSVRVHSPEMTRAAQRREFLERELRSVVASDGLDVHYQPVVRLDDRVPVGAEALARWHHPIEGDVAADEWVPIAEETGLIPLVGKQVRRRAASDLAIWDRAGVPPLRIAMNVSPLEFREPGLAETILWEFKRAGVLPARLAVELTESAFAGEHAIVDGLRQLRETGVKTAIDDFGTGHSALSHLASLPVDLLKIDRSFVARLPEHPESRAIVEGVVMLAHRLGLQIVAEGIEGEEQAAYLAEIGCEFGQGYLFARPMPAATFAEWIEQARPMAA